MQTSNALDPQSPQARAIYDLAIHSTIIFAGDLLFQIDPRPFETALGQAKGTLAKDQATQAKTDADEKRAQDLFSKKVISDSERELIGLHPTNVTESESRAAFERYVVAGPNRMLLQAAFGKFTPRAATSVNFRNDTRAPLLLVAGGKNRVAPSSLVKANFDLYRQSKAETDYKEYPNQSHFTFLQETKVADYVLGWAVCRVDSAQTLASFPNRKASWSVQLSA
jgi:pimeloyl-ACP methyl ester carboxylesterase